MQGFSCFFLIVTLTLTSPTVDRLFFLASTVCPYIERYWYGDLCENLAKFSCPKQKGLRENTPKGHWESTPRSPTTRATTKKIPKNQKPLTWRYMTKPFFSLRHRRDPETTSPQGTLPPDLDCELVKGVSPLALLRIARCSLKKSTYTDLTNEVAKKVLHKKASGPMLISESSSLNQSRCFSNLAFIYQPRATGGNNKCKKNQRKINEKSTWDAIDSSCVCRSD